MNNVKELPNLVPPTCIPYARHEHYVLVSRLASVPSLRSERPAYRVNAGPRVDARVVLRGTPRHLVRD
jgi:hypothetical protein